MQRPIEKYRWKKQKEWNDCIQFIRETDETCFLGINKEDGLIFMWKENSGYIRSSLDELQAIYETAKQIKEESNGN